MPKRRGRPAKPKAINGDTANKDDIVPEKNENEFQDPEVERQVAAIRALRDVEVEQLMAMLRVLRLQCSKEEQAKVRVLDFFREKLPNLLIMKNEEKGHFEVQWKDENGSVFAHQAGGGNIDVSLLHGFSMLYKDFPTLNPALGGFEFSNKSVKTSLFGVETLQIPSFVVFTKFLGPYLGANGLCVLKDNLEEPSESHNIAELQDKFQTPNVNNQRLSIGMTPKTLRLPKAGEMLLSVHGSPLGVFKEDNMEAINEVEDA